MHVRNELLFDLCPVCAIDLCHCLSHAVALGMALVLRALDIVVWAASQGCGRGMLCPASESGGIPEVPAAEGPPPPPAPKQLGEKCCVRSK